MHLWIIGFPVFVKFAFLFLHENSENKAAAKITLLQYTMIKTFIELINEGLSKCETNYDDR